MAKRPRLTMDLFQATESIRVEKASNNIDKVIDFQQTNLNVVPVVEYVVAKDMARASRPSRANKSRNGVVDLQVDGVATFTSSYCGVLFLHNIPAAIRNQGQGSCLPPLYFSSLLLSCFTSRPITSGAMKSAPVLPPLV